MNLREAAQMALQALQESKPIDINDPTAFYRSAHAIEALRARLAQPEPEPMAWIPVTQEEVAAAWLDTPLEAAGLTRVKCLGDFMNKLLRERNQITPQTKPASWGVQEGENLHDVFLFKDEADEMCRLKGLHARAIPLYTAPPQREWQGLTDEQIQKIEMSASSKLSAIYITEAQLKGKNS